MGRKTLLVHIIQHTYIDRCGHIHAENIHTVRYQGYMLCLMLGNVCTILIYMKYLCFPKANLSEGRQTSVFCCLLLFFLAALHPYTIDLNGSRKILSMVQMFCDVSEDATFTAFLVRHSPYSVSSTALFQN